jgi:hypothetical protein
MALDLDATIYALDSTTIDLCLSLFRGAHFRRTKSAIKLHTLLDLRGPIPAFIHMVTGNSTTSMYGTRCRSKPDASTCWTAEI